MSIVLVDRKSFCKIKILEKFIILGFEKTYKDMNINGMEENISYLNLELARLGSQSTLPLTSLCESCSYST